MKFVLLKTFPSDVDAHLVKTKLESEGIEVFLFNENFSTLFPNLYGVMGSGVQLQVAASNAEAALKILNEIAPRTDKVACPNCSSDHLIFGFNQTGYRAVLVFLSLIIMAPFGDLLRRRYLCKHCGTEFKL